MNDTAKSSFRSQMGPLFFLGGVFFLNFLSRIVLGPLMPSIEQDLKVGHGEAGTLFLLVSIGYCIMLVGSSYVSFRLNHRRTIILSSVAVGGILLFVGLSHHLWEIRFGLFALGMAAGLYFPSGIATLTGLVNPNDFGKAIAIHELAPSLGFVAAPMLVEILLRWCSWHGVLILYGIASLLSGILFIFFGKGGTFRGEALDAGAFRIILEKPSYWIILIFFSLGIGANFGLYSMLSLYLVSELGMASAWANTLLGLSRIPTSVIVFLAGWVTDRVGPKQALKIVFLCTGTITLLLGVAPDSWIILILFLQSMLASSFVPPVFAIISRMGGRRFSHVAISLTMPISFLIGGGVIPAGIGLMGKMGSLSFGIAILGGLLIVSIMLVRYLKFPNE